MNGELPFELETALMEMGVLSTHELDIDIPDEPKFKRSEFNMPDLDENGEPPF